MNKSEYGIQTLGTKADKRVLNSVCDLQDKFRNAIWQFDKMYDVTYTQDNPSTSEHIGSL